MTLPEGTRVRMLAGAWAEREGCEGVVVAAPNGPGVYPDDPRDKRRVVVLLDDDPLRDAMTPGGIFDRDDRDAWTCALDVAYLEVVSA